MSTTAELEQVNPVKLTPKDVRETVYSGSGVERHRIEYTTGTISLAAGTDICGRDENQDGLHVTFFSTPEGRNAVNLSVVDGMGGYLGGTVAQQIVRDSLLDYATSNTIAENQVPALEYANTNIVAFKEALRYAVEDGLRAGVDAYAADEKNIAFFAEKNIDRIEVMSIADYALQLITQSPDYAINRMNREYLNSLREYLIKKNGVQTGINRFEHIKNKIAPELSRRIYVSLTSVMRALEHDDTITEKQRQIIHKGVYTFIMDEEPGDYAQAHAKLKEMASAEFDIYGRLINAVPKLKNLIDPDNGMSILSTGAAALTALAVDNRVYMAYVGDCSAARFSKNRERLQWVTREDTLGNDMLDNPEDYFDEYISQGSGLTPEQKTEIIREAAKFKMHILLSSIGRRTLNASRSKTMLKSGDVLFLMSDGLRNSVDDQILQEVAAMVSAGKVTAAEARDLLLENSPSKPGDDNRTIIFLHRAA